MSPSTQTVVSRGQLRRPRGEGGHAVSVDGEPCCVAKGAAGGLPSLYGRSRLLKGVHELAWGAAEHQCGRDRALKVACGACTATGAARSGALRDGTPLAGAHRRRSRRSFVAKSDCPQVGTTSSCRRRDRRQTAEVRVLLGESESAVGLGRCEWGSAPGPPQPACARCRPQA